MGAVGPAPSEAPPVASAAVETRHVAATEPDASDVALGRAVVGTLVYADLFDHPLTRDQIQRYLIGRRASAAEIGRVLDAETLPGGRVERTGELFHLAGRSAIVETRRAHADVSASAWPVARRWGGAIARLPFVRLVAVTGALAMDNADARGDIDLFLLVRPGRVWLCRLLVVAMVKLAARRGHRLCPNFLLDTDHLSLRERSLYTAREVAQMVPLERTRWYRAFIDANDWARELLPNAIDSLDRARHSLDRAPEAEPRAPLVSRLAAWALATRVFDPLERWEMRRKIRRLEARARREGGSVAFSAHECRGHFAAHDARVLAAFAARAARYDAVPPVHAVPAELIA